MKKGHFYIICILATWLNSACQQQMICPAYHSYFILDVDETHKTFSLFGPDSLPKKNWEVEKEKYGIAKHISKNKKLKQMRIISMNSIYKKLEDPMDQFQHDLSATGPDQIQDTTMAIAKGGEYNDFQNVDQMIYLYHFGKYLPKKNMEGDFDMKEDLKDEKPLIESSADEEVKPRKKRKLWPFKKKNKKKKADSAPASEEENQ